MMGVTLGDVVWNLIYCCLAHDLLMLGGHEQVFETSTRLVRCGIL